MQLTEKQSEVKSILINYLKKPIGYVLLYGFAGTGKTVTISHTLREYSVKYGGNIAMTAPVNKAVKVLKDTMNIPGAAYVTIHSLLGLRPKTNNRTGVLEFVLDKNSKNNVHRYDVIVVDESSMLNEELFTLLMGVKKPIIFVGDYKQLRPVGDEHKVAAPFRSFNRGIHMITAVGLTEIIRQGAESGIIPLSAMIRKGYHSPDIISKFVNKYDDLSRSSIKDVLAMYSTEGYRQDPNHCKVIAYTNRRVDYLNTQIRNHIYNYPSSKLVEGERLVVNKPILREGVVLYTTNDEFEVLGYTIETLHHSGMDLKVYTCRVDDGVWINILHEDSQDDYDTYVEALRTAAISTKNPRYWAQMYGFMGLFADISYSYAITCHKSQGSTYQNVFICEQDFNKCMDKDDKQSLWYVGVTRASKKVFFI